MPNTLSSEDAKILRVLQVNCRLTIAEIAERTSMSSSSCWRRIRALEDSGAIEKYAAVVDPKKVGLGFEALVHIQLDRHANEGVQAFVTAIERSPEVVECYATSGVADYHLRVICKNIDVYNHFQETVLFRLSCVRSAQTNIILKKIKTNAPVPVE